jgi:cell division septation protein DedD
MEAGLRDLERIEERDEDVPARRLATLLLAALATVGLVCAMALLLGRAEPVEAEAVEDPLAALDLRDEVAAEAENDDTPVDVDRESLSFPETLAYDRRPEVEAALVAAAAEIEHPDPIPAGMALGDAVATGSAVGLPPEATATPVAMPMPVDDSPPDTLPAGSVVGSGPEMLGRQAPRDPLVAAAMPAATPTSSVPPGCDGELTVQVISYQNADEAELFAQALRDRGHAAFVTSAEIPDRGRFYRVRIGPFETMREAEEYRRNFESEERMNTIIIRQQDEDETRAAPAEN